LKKPTALLRATLVVNCYCPWRGGGELRIE
jgi:hypothetical protein